MTFLTAQRNNNKNPQVFAYTHMEVFKTLHSVGGKDQLKYGYNYFVLGCNIILQGQGQYNQVF